MASIIQRIEGVISHGARLLGVASKLDLAGLRDGKIDALLDTGLLLIQDDILDSIGYRYVPIVLIMDSQVAVF